MSFDAKNINPIDFKKDYAVGINLPFSAPAVFNSNYTTQEAIKNNLSNFFLTNVGERYLFPTFGGNLRATLFEQTSTITVESLKELISISLEEFFSTVQVVELEVLPNEEQQQLVVLLRYNIIDTGISDNLELTFE
jgi:phage baseplate assembly protein W